MIDALWWDLTINKETNPWSGLWGHFSVRLIEIGRHSGITEKAHCMQGRHLADTQHSLLCFVFPFWLWLGTMWPDGSTSVTMLSPLWWTVTSSYELRRNPSLNCICQFFRHKAWKVTDTRHIKTTSFYQSKKTELQNQTNCYKVTCHILSLPPSSLDSPLPDHFIDLRLFYIMPCLKQLKAMHS